jgi:hypothetical protein
LASVNVDANASATVNLSFTIAGSGWQQAEVSLTDYPVTFDDNYYFSFNVKEHLNVLALNGNLLNPYLQALFKNDNYFMFNNASVNQVDYSSFQTYQLIVLNEVKEISSGLAQELKKYIEAGGTVFIFPSVDADIDSYKNFLEPLGSNYPEHFIVADDKVARIESQHSLFADVFENKKSIPENLDLPVVSKYFLISKNTHTREEALLKLLSGNTFLSVNDYKKGSIFLSSVPLNEDYSSLPKHALFVPVMLKAAFRASSEIRPSLIIGRTGEVEAAMQANTGENVFHLKNDHLHFDIIPEIKMVENKSYISVHDQVKKAGNYELVSDQKIQSCISFNYDRSESDLRCYTADELNGIVQKRSDLKMNTVSAESADLTHAVLQLNEGVRMWKYCIILALIFFAMEVLIIRFIR